MLKRVLFISLLLFIVVTEGCRRCPRGIEKVKCKVNPCRGQRCKGARCRANYCGGCNRLWYTSDGSDVTQKCECTCSTFECPSSTNCKPAEIHKCLVNPCDFAKCPNYPKATCCPSYCGGCKDLWFENGKPVLCFNKG